MEPQPITQAQADAIGDILRAEYDSNPAFREIVNAKAAALETAPRLIGPNRQEPSAFAPAKEPARGVAA